MELNEIWGGLDGGFVGVPDWLYMIPTSARYLLLEFGVRILAGTLVSGS